MKKKQKRCAWCKRFVSDETLVEDVYPESIHFKTIYFCSDSHQDAYYDKLRREA